MFLYDDCFLYPLKIFLLILRLWGDPLVLSPSSFIVLIAHLGLHSIWDWLLCMVWGWGHHYLLHGEHPIWPCSIHRPSFLHALQMNLYCKLGNHICEHLSLNSISVGSVNTPGMNRGWPKPHHIPMEDGGSGLLLPKELLCFFWWITWPISALFWLLPLDTTNWLTKWSK